MPRSRKQCRICGAKASSGVYITRHGYCLDCSRELTLRAMREMTERRGEYWQHWLRRPGAARVPPEVASNTATRGESDIAP